MIDLSRVAPPSGARLAALATLFSLCALQACGGGGSSSSPAPAPAPGPGPTVSAVDVAVTTFGAPALVTISGANLDTSVNALVTGCTDIVILDDSSHPLTTEVIYGQCTVQAYEGEVTVRDGSGHTLRTGSFTLPRPTVASLAVSATRYASPATVTVQGTHLDQGVALSGCKNPTLLTQAPTQSTATTAYFGCTVSGALTGTVTVQAGDGANLGTAPFTVPPPQVTMSVTNGLGVAGDIILTLTPDETPLTVDNFLAYVNSGFYDATIFHRVVPGFVIQGGGYGATVNGALPAPKATNAPIATETGGGNNVQWSVAMARSALPVSTTSQFFFNPVDNSQVLGNAYAVFGNITSGVSVAQAILAAPATCTSNPGAGTTDCLPHPDVTVVKATQTQ